jgi:hypothetical protein
MTVAVTLRVTRPGAHHPERDDYIPSSFLILPVGYRINEKKLARFEGGLR